MVQAEHLQFREYLDPDAEAVADVFKNPQGKKVFLRMYGRLINNQLKSLVKASEVDDVEQEVVRRLIDMSYMGRLKEVVNFRAFLNRVVTYTAYEIRWARKRRENLRKRMESKPPDHDFYGKDEESALDTLVREETRGRVRAALSKLGSEHRTAIELFYFEGLASAEAAQRLSIENHTFRQRLVRGRRKLEAILKKAGITEEDL